MTVRRWSRQDVGEPPSYRRPIARDWWLLIAAIMAQQECAAVEYDRFMVLQDVAAIPDTLAEIKLLANQTIERLGLSNFLIAVVRFDTSTRRVDVTIELPGPARATSWRSESPSDLLERLVAAGIVTESELDDLAERIAAERERAWSEDDA